MNTNNLPSNEVGKKKCPSCKEVKPMDDFPLLANIQRCHNCWKRDSDKKKLKV